MNLQTGAFGDPAQTETLILFWGKMEELHYPGAGTTKKYLEDKAQREQQQMLQMQMMQQAQHTDSKQEALLCALKPYLVPERRDKIDRALRIARLSQLASFALRNSGGLFGKEGKHV